MTAWIYDRPPTSQDGDYVGNVLIRNTQEQEQATGQLCAHCDWKDVPAGAAWRACWPTHVRSRMEPYP